MQTHEKRLTLAALAIIGVAFYVLNVLTPLCADDYSYMYTFIYTDNKFRITNLSQLFYSQLNHYMVMNGRTVAHTLAQLFLMWGKPVFNVVNTAAFLILGWAMQALMTGQKKFKLSLFIFSIAMLWFLTPAFGQDFLWLTGSCTYLYCVLFVLLYMIPFRRACANESKGGVVRAILFLLFGLLAGWSSENAALAMIVMIACFLVVLRINNRPLKGWMFTGLAGNLAGLALLLLAPGQAVRLENSGGMGSLMTWLYRGLEVTKNAVRYLWFPAMLFLVLVIWLLWTERKDGFKTEWRKKLPIAVFLIGSLVSAYCMIVTPQFPARAWSCILIFTIITVGNLICQCKYFPQPRIAKYVICVVVLGAAIFTYGQAYNSLFQTCTAVEQRSAYIEAALDNGETEVTVEPIRAFSKYNCYKKDGDLGLDSTQWPNTAIARYYGLDAIHSTEERGEFPGE